MSFILSTGGHHVPVTSHPVFEELSLFSTVSAKESRRRPRDTPTSHPRRVVTSVRPDRVTCAPKACGSDHSTLTVSWVTGGGAGRGLAGHHRLIGADLAATLIAAA